VANINSFTGGKLHFTISATLYDFSDFITDRSIASYKEIF